MTERFVLDASALLALLNREPGGDAVAMIIAATMISTVNWSEVLQKARRRGVDTNGIRDDLVSMGMELVPFGVAEAEAAADLWWAGAGALALGDRACLATAQVRELPVVTADRAWASLVLGSKIQVIR